MQEIRVLGRGAYGLAVAAVNRLDGRQYAVKKIRLQRQVPSEFSRIMREVATLSRLQHTNIVRYFQVSIQAQPVPIERNNHNYLAWIEWTLPDATLLLWIVLHNLHSHAVRTLTLPN